MANDNIPNQDLAFNLWVVPFSAYITANAAALAIDPADALALANAVTAWTAKYSAHTNAAAAALAATTGKDQARAAVEALARPLIQILQASTKVTDAQRNTMKINVRAKTRTPSSAPTTAPIASVDISQRLRHIISYRDSATPGSKKKPKGVKCCEVWAKIGGPPPTDASQLTYLGNASASPQMEEFTGAQAGQTVYYWLRWVSTQGEFGPWSDPVTATIPG
jgi:hypothetical protein